MGFAMFRLVASVERLCAGYALVTRASRIRRFLSRPSTIRSVLFRKGLVDRISEAVDFTPDLVQWVLT